MSDFPDLMFMHDVSHFNSVNIEFGWWWWTSDEVSCIREQLKFCGGLFEAHSCVLGWY